MKISMMLIAVLLMSQSCQEPTPSDHSQEQSASRATSCGNGPVRYSGNTKMPRPIERITPVLHACDFDEASVTVAITVSAEGKVVQAEITEASLPCVDKAVLEAYRHARYCPAERAGELVQITFTENLKLKKNANHTG